MSAGRRKGRALLKPLALLGALFLLFLAQGEVAHAATITVNTTDDELNSDGDCSLREAIQAANTDAAVDACTAGSGADTIDVPAGTYTLSIAGAGEDANATGDLDITDDLTINGAGAPTTIIDGGALDRVFDVDPNVVSITVEISSLTIDNGSADLGGGILNSGALTLSGSTVSGNTASLHGGGIFDYETVTINSSTVSGNTAVLNGGGIYHVGPVTVNNSTVSGNTAAGLGAGGIFNSSTTLNFNNSTISGNTGGGISSGNTNILKNTVFASNTAGDCIGGTVTSLGNNLDSDGSCNLIAAGDLPNTNPLLGPLADNGGPTQTHALLVGSPAIDAGSGDCPPPATDQRGVARPQGAACDIGAFELEVGVGGIAEVLVGGGEAPVRTGAGSGSSSLLYAAIAGGTAAAAVALAAGGWYAMRRWLR
jgi:CSLREA domain-containing protein